MGASFLEHILSRDNKHNKRYVPSFPVYKFHKLYSETNSLSESEKQKNFYVEKEDKTGFYLINPFLVSVLATNSLWFSPAKDFNDPWDAGGAVSIIRNDKFAEEKILKIIFDEEELNLINTFEEEKKYLKIEDKIRNEFSRLRFCCFTKHFDNNPMWAHYADNHKGICMQFRFFKTISNSSGVINTYDKNFAGCYPVRYSSNEFINIGDLSDIGSVIEVLYSKHEDWNYEKEVRFIKFGHPDFPNLGGHVSFNKQSLTALILGCKVPDSVCLKVEKLLNEYQYKSTTLIKTIFDFRNQKLSYLKRQGANLGE